MNPRRFFFILLLISAPNVHGQESRRQNDRRSYEIFWAPYSFSRQGSADLHGGELGFTWNINDDLGFTADMTAHRMSSLGAQVDFLTYRVGPRLTARSGDRLTFFAHGLFGGSRVIGSAQTIFGTLSQSAGGSAVALGGGVDIGIRPWFHYRFLQGEYSFVRFGPGLTSDGFRIGTGLVFRFGQ